MRGLISLAMNRALGGQSLLRRTQPRRGLRIPSACVDRRRIGFFKGSAGLSGLQSCKWVKIRFCMALLQELAVVCIIFLLPILFCYSDVAVERVELRARMALSGYNRRQSAETVLCRKVSGFD